MANNTREGPKLTAKQEKFVQGLIEGKSQRQAYIDAGYSTKGKTPEYIDTEACKLFKNPKVSQRYNLLMEEHKEKALITREELLQKLLKGLDMALGDEETKMAVISFGKLYEKTGKKTNLKALAQIADIIAKLEDFYPKENSIIGVNQVVIVDDLEGDDLE